MVEHSRFHHVGVAVLSIKKAAAWYENAGYKRSSTLEDPVQKVRICWMSHDGAPLVELVEPMGNDSPVSPILKRAGPGPYHSCYCVPDLGKAVAKLRQGGALQLGRPVPAPAISGSSIVFMYSRDAGLIELVEEPGIPAGFDS